MRIRPIQTAAGTPCLARTSVGMKDEWRVWMSGVDVSYDLLRVRKAELRKLGGGQVVRP